MKQAFKYFVVAFLGALLVACGGGGGGGSNSGAGGSQKPKDVRMEFLVGETMNLEMEGTGSAWNWYKDGEKLNNDSRVITSFKTLKIRDLVLTDSGTYWATYQRSGNQEKTNKVFVTVNNEPVELKDFPEIREVVIGEKITLSAPVKSGTNLSFQWYRGASMLAGEDGETLEIEIDNEAISSYSVEVWNDPEDKHHSSSVELLEVEQYATGYWQGRKGFVSSDIIVEPNGDFWMVAMESTFDRYVLFQRGKISTENNQWSLERMTPDQSSLYYYNPFDVDPYFEYGNMEISKTIVQQRNSLSADISYESFDESMAYRYKEELVEQNVGMSDLVGLWQHADVELEIDADGDLIHSGSFFTLDSCRLTGNLEKVAKTGYLYRLKAEVNASSGVCPFSGGKIDAVATLLASGRMMLIYSLTNISTGEILYGAGAALER